VSQWGFEMGFERGRGGCHERWEAEGLSRPSPSFFFAHLLHARRNGRPARPVVRPLRLNQAFPLLGVLCGHDGQDGHAATRGGGARGCFFFVCGRGEGIWEQKGI
jgi:hypothetical protein